MIPAKCSLEMTENDFATISEEDARQTLVKFTRTKILEVYFARLGEREPEIVNIKLEELYRIDLKIIKSFLLGQHPQDPILLKLLKELH